MNCGFFSQCNSLVSLMMSEITVRQAKSYISYITFPVIIQLYRPNKILFKLIVAQRDVVVFLTVIMF